MPLIAYISGHVDLDQDDFDKHYKDKIDKAISEGHWFIVGNARGADSMALKYLKEKKVEKERVLVYYYTRHKDDPRQLQKNSLWGYPWSDGFNSYTHRDACATEDSDYDILWVRPALETEMMCRKLNVKYDPQRISGTEKNFQRRIKANITRYPRKE